MFAAWKTKAPTAARHERCAKAPASFNGRTRLSYGRNRGSIPRAGSIPAAILASLLLAACTTPQGPEPTVQIRTVSVPVAVKCAVDPGPEPNYVDTAQAIAAAPNIFELAKLYAQGRAQRIGRLIELQAANAGCR